MNSERKQEKQSERLGTRLTKDRVVDESLRRQINSENEYVCEKHFRKEQ